MRVHADREPASGHAADTVAARAHSAVVFGGENHERAPHAGRARPRDDGVEIGDEFLAGDMAVVSITSRSDRLSDSAAARVPACRLDVQHDGRAAVGAGGEHHAVRLEAHHLARRQVGDDHDGLADHGFRLVRLGDAGENGARLRFAGVDLQLQQLLRLRHALGLEHLADLQLDLHEVVDGDQAPVPAGACGCRRVPVRCRCHGCRCRRVTGATGAVRRFSACLFSHGHNSLVCFNAGPQGARVQNLLLARRAPGGVVVQPPFRRRRGVAQAAQDLGRRRRHHRRQQHRGNANGLGRVGEHAVQPIGIRRILGQRPRLRLGDVVVRRARPGGTPPPRPRAGRARPSTPCSRDVLGGNRGQRRRRRPSGWRPSGSARSSTPRGSPGCRGCWPGRRCTSPRTAPT